MSDSEQQLVVCPVEVDGCQWLEQLSRLADENEELKRLVTTDTLTGLNNYRYFCEHLSKEMERTRRAGRPTCIVMIDLDHFKAINDKRGHEAGNQALKVAAEVFRQSIRLSDVVCRYGGEEFVIILPQTPLRTAVTVAERVRVWLEQSQVEFEGECFGLTASLGVGIFQQHESHTLKSFVASVDQFMYQAKQQGRNRVCHADYATQRQETSVSAEEKAALFPQ